MIEIIIPLIGLALVDSTSIGTLLIPLWLLSRPQLRPLAIVMYIAVIVLFYFALGSLLLAGFDFLKLATESSVVSRTIDWLQLAIGIGLMVLMLRPNRNKVKESKMGRLKSKLATANHSLKASTTLALVAGLLEAATMLPYLAAIGFIVNANLGMAMSYVFLFAYCIVMVLPAVILFGLRIGMESKIYPQLVRFQQWTDRHLKANNALLFGIIGFFIARDALWRLGFFDLFIQ